VPDSSFPFPHLSPHRFPEKGTSILLGGQAVKPRASSVRQRFVVSVVLRIAPGVDVLVALRL
jgi:hypothetical protein